MFEGYKESTASGFRSDTLDVRTTTSSYDINGNLIGINGNGDGQVAKSFINDTNGIIVQQSTGNDANAPSSLTRQIVSNGQVWGSYGFAQPSAALATPAINFNNLPPGMVISATQFDASFQPINSGYPSASVGSYLVQTGDTLQSIAQSAYGDRQLWFVIAQANGLMSDADLKVGHSLTIPSRVGSVHNTADTFKPYNPSELIGDTTPTLPVPQNDDDGCGFLGQLIMIIVAVVVTVATGGIGGAILGSVASQVVGNVLGVVDGFSWKSVALAAITAGVGQGVDAAFGGAASGIGDTILRAVVKNAITQGIGVATGLQDSFDWRGVAAAGIGAGVGFKVGELIGDKFGNGVGGQIAKSTVTGFASGLASAAVRGGKISVGAIAADAFGNALGGYLGEQLKPQPMSTAGSDKYSAEEQQADARRENNRFSSAFYVNSVADEVQVTPAPMPLYEGDENGHLAIALPQYEGGHGHGDGSSRNPMYSLGGGSDSGLRLGGGLGLSHGGIRVNQVDSTAAITEEDAVGGLNDRNGLDLQSDQVTGGSNPSNPDRTVKVRSGQTLSGIAGTNDSDTLDRIAQYNGLRSRHEVRAGATLIIPSADVLAGVEVSGSVSQRGAAGGVYYANRQAQADAQMRSDAAARATNPDYGNEGRNNPAGADTPLPAGWNIRDASAASMAQERQQAELEYQARLANGPQLKPWDGISSGDRFARTAQTIDSIVANPFGALGYLAGKAGGMSEGDASMLAAVGAIGGDLLTLRAGARNSTAKVDEYASGLYRKNTPTTTAAGRFEVEYTGPYNYRVVGGGTTIDIDGYRGATILEAKHVGNVGRSPYIADSDIPPFLREKILREQQSEFQRLGAVARDPAVPFNRVEVLTNQAGAVPYFRDLMTQYNVPGVVRVVPAPAITTPTKKP